MKCKPEARQGRERSELSKLEKVEVRDEDELLLPPKVPDLT